MPAHAAVRFAVPQYFPRARTADGSPFIRPARDRAARALPRRCADRSSPSASARALWLCVGFLSLGRGETQPTRADRARLDGWDILPALLPWRRHDRDSRANI